jgi:hypothetical protein
LLATLHGPDVGGGELDAIHWENFTATTGARQAEK